MAFCRYQGKEAAWYMEVMTHPSFPELTRITLARTIATLLRLQIHSSICYNKNESILHTYYLSRRTSGWAAGRAAAHCIGKALSATGHNWWEMHLFWGQCNSPPPRQISSFLLQLLLSPTATITYLLGFSVRLSKARLNQAIHDLESTPTFPEDWDWPTMYFCHGTAIGEIIPLKQI